MRRFSNEIEPTSIPSSFLSIPLNKDPPIHLSSDSLSPPSPSLHSFPVSQTTPSATKHHRILNIITGYIFNIQNEGIFLNYKKKKRKR